MEQANSIWEILIKDIAQNNINGILYYDETNNFRHLRLTDKGANNPIGGMSFFLGGLGVASQKAVDCSILMTELAALDLDEVSELKFKHFSYGKTDFLDILKSKRLNKLFQWIAKDDNLFIHIASINYLFWILIDIVDEALKDHDNVLMFHLGLKSALYDAITSDLDGFMKRLYAFGFPNVADEDIHTFVGFLLAYIENKQFEEREVEDDFFTEFLRQLIKAMRKNKEFLFLSNNTKYTLFDAYASIYEREIVTFNTAKLVFDNEPTIESKIIKSLNGSYENFMFKDSKDDRFLQLSDAIVGFTSKLNSYVENTAVEILVQNVIAMNELQRKNLRLWFDIENKSNDLCPILFCHMQPLSIRQKMGVLEKVVESII